MLRNMDHVQHLNCASASAAAGDSGSSLVWLDVTTVCSSLISSVTIMTGSIQSPSFSSSRCDELSGTFLRVGADASGDLDGEFSDCYIKGQKRS